MKVKKFYGATSREVLKQVREALGPDAVILSNRSLGEGVEVLAIADKDMASIVSAPDPSQAAAPVASDTVEVRSLLRNGPQGFAPAKPERRVQHALPACNPPSAPIVERRNAAPIEGALSAEIKSMRDLLERQLSALGAKPREEVPPANAELVAEMKSLRAAFQQQVANLARAADAQKAMADRGLAAENARLAAEIGTLRSLVERELAGLAWNETARRQPGRAELLRRCVMSGFSATLARNIAEIAPTDLHSRDAAKWLSAHLEHNLPVAVAEDIVERGGVYALVGPTGVGKTTTTAKLAARCAVKFGAKNLALISADSYRIGAQDHLRAYGKILGVPVHTVQNTGTALADVLASLKNKHLVLIDTVGLAQRDTRVSEQIQGLVDNKVKRVLLLNAAAQPEAIEDVVDVYQGDGLIGCILTKIDEAVKLGGVLDAVLRHQLPLHYVANGQRVPEDLHAPNAQYLAHRALRAVTPQALVMEDEEIGMTIAPRILAEAQHAA